MSSVGTWGWRDLRVVGVGVAAGMLAVLALVGAKSRAPGGGDPGTAAGWSEIAWPLPVDPWWPSKAFTCSKASCGLDLTLYVRAKIGFCNCSTGVADDEELERIGDFGVLASRHEAKADGRPIAVAWMKGRSRPYALTPKEPAPGASDAATALLVGYNDRCDAIVATALLERGDPMAAERPVLEFLNSPRVMQWAERTLGL